MKQLIISILSVILLLTISACDDVIEDYVPIEWNIVATDAEGNNIFDADFEGNIISQTTITYMGEDYRVVDLDTHYAELDAFRYSRATGPVPFCSPWTDKSFRYDNKTIVLHIGEWSAERNWDKVDVTLNLPDGTHTVLSFSLNGFGWNHAKYYVNGKKVNGPIVKLVR